MEERRSPTRGPGDTAGLMRTGVLGPRAVAKFGTQLLDLFADRGSR